MKGLHRHGWALPILLYALASSGEAQAQEAGYQLNRLVLAPAGDPFTVVEFPQYAADLPLSLRLGFDYSNDAIAASGVDGEGNPLPSPIAHSQYARFGATANVGRLSLTLDIPALLFEDGKEFGGIGPSGAAVADPRVGLRGLLYGDPNGPISLSASLGVWIPVNGADKLVGDKNPRVLPQLILGGKAMDGRIRWAANAGYLYRQTAFISEDLSPVGNTVGSEIRLAVGASYEEPRWKLSVGPEATVAFAIDSDLPDEQKVEIAELFATGRYAIDDSLSLGVGVGTAVRGFPGPPDFRGMVTLSYSPRRRLAPASSYELVVLVPDEDGHVGSLEVQRGKSTTVLDSAYESTELKGKDRAPRVVTASPSDVAARVDEVAAVLPPLDRDADGVPDKDDACPERKGRSSSDPLRHGCPRSVEKVVVLPDEDGNVGAIEIDDGKTITLVDKPYASVEVGNDGKAQGVVQPSKKVETAIARAVAPMAEVLPVADADEDGIRDGDDACPERQGQPSADPLRNGCPPASEKIVVLPDADGHVGAIEIDDGKTKIVVDKPYASAEVSADGAVAAVEPAAAPMVVEKTIAEVATVLPVADSDGDGIGDATDACPSRAGVASPLAHRSGCPKTSETVVVLPDENGHVGALEITDASGKTVLLDKAYATAEIGADGAALSVAAERPAVVNRNVKDIAAVLPPPDQDDDGIVDKNDACKNRAGLSNPDPGRHGCPKPVERIVLLPDEDGHVGAIEVGEGSNVVVLDKALQTFEIGTDGGALEGDVHQREVDTDFAEVIATAKAAKKQLPKSAGRVHFTVYFDEQAIPTRDVDEQIDALMEELESQDDYSIEVVGHTDATGSNRANQRVGLARASEIAARLSARGVPASRVSATTRGSAEPAVEVMNPTKVPEPLNRRVEIRIKEPGLPQLVVPFIKSTRTSRNMKAEFKALAQRLSGLESYKIVVVGHVDLTETKRALSKKRADSVARGLRRAGIPKDRIEVVAKDATDPAVEQTANTPEPINRRVEIYVTN